MTRVMIIAITLMLATQAHAETPIGMGDKFVARQR
jgi:hypothetical protein